jgi:hypothetical protein
MMTRRTALRAAVKLAAAFGLAAALPIQATSATPMVIVDQSSDTSPLPQPDQSGIEHIVLTHDGEPLVRSPPGLVA